MDVSPVAWVALAALVVAMLLLDLLLHRDAHEIQPREAGLWSAIWVAMGLAVGGVIWWYYGSDFGVQYLTAYVVEKSLAIDNVFIWALVFSYFAVPARFQHRVLFYGVVGALVLRAGFIAAGAALVSNFSWVLYLFGVFLVLTGVKMLRDRSSHSNPADSRLVRWFQSKVRSTDEFHGDKFWIKTSTGRLATPLLSALVVVEFTDIIFAVDSIPAVFAVTQEPFLVFASNALAILGLRAMYFLLADLIQRFVYLKVGLAAVLVWVGSKMLVGHDLVHIPSAVSLVVVLAILTSAVVASLIKEKKERVNI